MKSLSLAGNVDAYIEEHFIKNDPDLEFAIKNAKRHNLPPIHLHPVQSSMISLMAQMTHAKNILEIGTLGGYSTLWLAKALPDDGKIVTIEHNKEYAQVAQESFDHSKHAAKVDLQIGEALEVLPTLTDQAPFDFFFIDAHKEEYIQYVEWAIKLGKKGSVILCDNVIRNGGILEEPHTKEYFKKLDQFNKWLAKNEKLESTILPTLLPLTGRDYLDGISISLIK